MNLYRLLSIIITGVKIIAPINVFSEDVFDIVIYGGTSAGVMAAVQGSRMGKSVVLIETGKHIGGMTSSGLGKIDKGEHSSIGGLTKEYFHRVWLYYQSDNAWNWEQKPPEDPSGNQTKWVLEPHVGESVFDSMAKEANISIVFSERLDRDYGVFKDEKRITKIVMESGRAFEGKMFIDASYEGDLMASAGVPYTVGREANILYQETINGFRPNVRRADIPRKIDVYLVRGSPTSGFLPRISAMIDAEDGAESRNIQAYNYRMCLTKVPENCILVDKPLDYDENKYEIIFRALEVGLKERVFFKLDSVPNRKTDSNNNGSISTDYVGMNWEYPEANYSKRDEIAKEHKSWQLGLIWTLQNHPRSPERVKNYYKDWGLPKDEFVDNDNWPYQLYIREARRMISDAVITENTAMGNVSVSDGIGLGSYQLDSHAAQYFVANDGFLMLEGCFFKPIPKPFPISYQAIVPKLEQCENLLVPVCLSCTHAAFGSIRMEPVFMILGQSAATAASLAIDLDIAIQKLPYPILRERLLNDGQIIE